MESNVRRNRALQLAGALAIATACYHGIVGDNMLLAIPMSEADESFVRGTWQLGTMGWLMGGILLIGAARLVSQPARNLIVATMALQFIGPAFGSLAVAGGVNIGGIGLASVVALALYGRRLVTPGETEAVAGVACVAS